MKPKKPKKRRCPSCRSGPVIIGVYDKVKVLCHCASCGHWWVPRERK